MGGYGADHDGAPGEGIGMLQAGDPDSGSAGGPLAFTGTAVAAASPSWLAPHPSLDVVYAALEHAGTVQAFRRVAENRLAPLGAPVAAGEAVCHVAVAPDGAFLLASCWGDGRVVRMPLSAEGVPGSPSVAPAAHDPYGPEAPAPEVDPQLAAAARALRAAVGGEFAAFVPEYDTEPASLEPELPAEEPRPSRAHQALFLPGGIVVTTDLGYDVVRVWRIRDGRLRGVQQVTLPQGSGPRHAVWHPSGHLYVLTELSREVFVLAPDVEGRWHVVGGAPAAPGSLDGDTAAELALSRDSAFLYAGIRGSDTIGVLRVRGAGDAVEPVALVEAGVGTPRHHVVVRDTLLVAGQSSDSVASLTLDLRSGVPEGIRSRAVVPAPTCLLPLR